MLWIPTQIPFWIVSNEHCKANIVTFNDFLFFQSINDFYLFSVQIYNSNLHHKYSQTWANDYLRIATTCLQRPPFWSPNLDLYNINQPLNNDHLPLFVVVVHRFDCTWIYSNTELVISSIVFNTIYVTYTYITIYLLCK